MDTMVEFKNVSKTFGDVKALDNVSFELKRGEIIGYIGPNGAGKTTSMKIMVGLIKQYQGKVSINQTEVRESGYDPRFVGYLPQETGFQEWRTVYQVMNTFGKLSGIPAHRIEERINEVLSLVSLLDMKKRKVVNLSGGMQQRLKLAQAILHEPNLVILDEPMNGLDPGSRFDVKNIKALKKEGKTIIFSSHILSDVQDIADTIAIINRGKIMKLGTPSELSNQFQVGNPVEIVFSHESSLPQALKTTGGIIDIKQDSEKKYIIVFDPKFDLDERLHEILKIIVDQKLHIRKINLLQPSLEDVYLKYVGGQSHV